MAIIVEDGTGLADAETWVDVAAVTTYLTNRNLETAWVAASPAAQEAALRESADYLTQTFRGLWKGTILTSTQVLPFPRENIVDEEGRDVTGVPDQLKNAQIELAALAISTSLVENLTTDSGIIKREKDKIDVIESETEYVGGKRTQPKFVKVERMLYSLLVAGYGQVTMVRA